MSERDAASPLRYLLPAAFLLVVALLGAWLMMPTPGPELPPDQTLSGRVPAGEEGGAAEPPGEVEISVEEAPTEGAPADRARDRIAAEGFHMSAPPGAIPPSTRPFDSPEAASTFVEGRVLGLFEAVAPQVDPKSIEKRCEPDGRICTFEGPWPGDDFLRQWLHAISEGRTGLEAMDGVRFSEFRPVEVEGQRRFFLKAHAP